MSGLLRHSPAEFEALRDTTSERLGVDRGAVEKDYWATVVLRSACLHDQGVDTVVFKGGTSLSKAFQLIERFSEVDERCPTGNGIAGRARAERGPNGRLADVRHCLCA